jgi:hypothetical protein
VFRRFDDHSCGVDLMRRRFCAIAFTIAAFALAAEAAETPAPQTPAPQTSEPQAPAIPPNDPAVQARMPGCAVWTDRCVTCRHEDGKVACSNTGIACQPQAVICLRADPTDAKKGEK